MSLLHLQLWPIALAVMMTLALSGVLYIAWLIYHDDGKE